MIKKLINKIFSEKISEKDIECAIDEDKVDCEHLDDDQDKAYVGVPAPVLNPVDEWFSSSYGCPTAITEKQKDYMEQETIIKQQQAQEAGREYNGEPCSIHQLMYEMATSNWNTVDETREAIGGSENFHEGPGGWKSGNGMSQFTR